MTRSIFFSLLCTVLLASAGCGEKGGESTEGGETPGKDGGAADNSNSIHDGNTANLARSGKSPAKNDTLLRYYGDDPDTLNLITSSDNVSSTFQLHVYDAFAQRKYGEPGIWEPQLAESWEFDPETLEYKIKLRKGVKWHPITLPNGTVIKDKEFTAKDVTFTFSAILNPNIEAASLRSYYTREDPDSGAEVPRVKVTRIDDYTVKVKWLEPYFMADEFTLGAGIMPRHVYAVDKNGEPISFDFGSKEFADGFNNHWANTTMCGTGPLRFQEWDKSKRVVFERNPDYFGAPFYFNRVVFRYVSNPNTARQMMLQNDLDIAGIPEADYYLEDKNHPNVKNGRVKLDEFRRTAYRYLGYNLRRPVFEDRNARMALSHAVPVDTIINEIYHGLAVRQTGPFIPWEKFSNPDVKPIRFDLDKARDLLDESGWRDSNENGIRDKEIDGKRVEFTFDLMIYSDSPQYLSIAEIIKESFRKIGVDVQISPAKWALMLQKLRKKEFDATILGWVSDWKSDPYQVWHGSQADLPESSNSIGYSNPEVDQLIEELRRTMDEDKQVELYHKIHQHLFDDQPYTFLYSDKGLIGYHSRLENVQFFPSLRPHYDARQWYSNSPRVLAE